MTKKKLRKRLDEIDDKLLTIEKLVGEILEIMEAISGEPLDSDEDEKSPDTQT